MSPALFINRELSWLAFNERVLEEAQDPGTPLLERVRFAAIVASNLDEFFMVRVAGLQQEVEDGDAAPDIAGLTPAQQLAAIRVRAHALVDALYELTTRTLMPALADQGIRILTVAELRRHSPRRPRKVLPRIRPAGAYASGHRCVEAVSAALVDVPEPGAPARCGSR